MPSSLPSRIWQIYVTGAPPISGGYSTTLSAPHPLDFVNNTRITKACMMLRTTEDSILNISENVGFRSVSSFNRYFIKKMQMSPRDYRKQMQQSDLRIATQTGREYSGWMYPE